MVDGHLLTMLVAWSMNKGRTSSAAGPYDEIGRGSCSVLISSHARALMQRSLRSFPALLSFGLPVFIRLPDLPPTGAQLCTLR